VNNGFLFSSFLVFWLGASFIFSGCVRVAGTAGYWHANAEGEAQAKQVGFDTADLVPKGKDLGNISV
jgi:hypothetical protein